MHSYTFCPNFSKPKFWLSMILEEDKLETFMEKLIGMYSR